MESIAKYRGIIFIMVLAVAVCIAWDKEAYAGNGTRMIGFSARDSAMAGATTASADDTSCLVRNPAGLVRIGNKIDVEYMNILPHDIIMDVEGPTRAALGNTTFGNVGLVQTSTIDYLPGGNAGISYRLPCTDKYPVSIGCGIFTMAGIAVNHNSPRLNSALLTNGNYDKMVDLRSMRIAPGIAFAINDNVSLGATGNIALQGFRTNLASSTVIANQYQQTAGAGDWDFAPGGGFTVGLLYKINEMLSLGTSYESRTWMGNHYKYKDLELFLIDEPPVINVGLSVKPVKNLELTYDMRYINWTAVKVARLAPIAGGFGWRDQWVFATGGEYTMFDKLKLRLGYNYGQTPLKQQNIFANALLPLIMEHHVTTGFSYLITKDLSFDLTWEHHFKATMSDDGTGDTYSEYGNGTKITAAAEVISVALGYKF